jgi:transcriptional regulator with XRE-family HTH domain
LPIIGLAAALRSLAPWREVAAWRSTRTRPGLVVSVRLYVRVVTIRSRAGFARLSKSVVHRSYVTNLRKGRIESPGYEKLVAIAKAMGFPPELWFEEDLDALGEAPPELDRHGIAGRLEHLYKTIRNPTTGEPYTNAEVVRMSAGDLGEEDVEGIRTGEIPDPTVSQVAVLASVFGVPPSYLLDRGREPTVLDEEVLEALADGWLHTQGELPPATEGEETHPWDNKAVWKPSRCP